MTAYLGNPHDSPIWELISDERHRQDRKWGDQRTLAQDRWMTIMTEEVGEVARSILEGDIENMKTELIQVAAVCIAFYEGVERNANGT